MSEEFDFSTGRPSDEMSQYLQMYLDETSEQLDALVESLLVLERHPADSGHLNEAFRLIHSIKGSSAMMGLDGITILTHHLENHFERLRSGLRELDEPTMGLILRCLDFLRECNRRMRAGEALASAPELLEELGALSSGSAPPRPQATAREAAAPTVVVPAEVAPAETVSPPAEEPPQPPAGTRACRILVRFEPELSLADLKAELILTRLASVAEVRETLPPRGELGAGELRGFQILVATAGPAGELRAAVDVDGVELIEIEEGATNFASLEAVVQAPEAPAGEAGAIALPAPSTAEEATPVGPAAGAEAPSAGASDASESKAKVAETVRVDIERLDNLMNLAGELVVNKAQFVQITRQMSPAFRKSGVAGRARAFGESIRHALRQLKVRSGNGGEGAGEGQEQFRELEAEIDALEEQAKLWEESRRCFGQLTEAIDQMTRVSDSLQRGVLDTRMVPVAPLFNRFKRVVRDIALDLKKKVLLEIHGEKTELDKRMIDELGDPLVHLIRNAIDHGIESAEVRARRGKPEAGTVRLEATHSGNNVLISVGDDGEGIPVEKVRSRIIERGLVSASAAADLSDREVVEFIWHPGFSTAETVSDISGRGVGMDIVRRNIETLRGTVTVASEVGRGTTFTIRLPLTLAIIRSLLFRVRQGIFAVPIDNVREIVSVAVDQVVTIHGRRTFEVRGEFIPLVDIDDIFAWHAVEYRYAGDRDFSSEIDPRRINVVILHSGEKTMGLSVDELHGGQDIVIKSLAENFIPIRGLSGASILGDGSVCLLFDVGAAIAMAADARRKGDEVRTPC